MAAHTMSASLIRSPLTPSRSEPSRICTPSHRMVLSHNITGRRSPISSRVEQALPRGQSTVVHAEPAQAATDAGGSSRKRPGNGTSESLMHVHVSKTGKMCHSDDACGCSSGSE